MVKLVQHALVILVLCCLCGCGSQRRQPNPKWVGHSHSYRLARDQGPKKLSLRQLRHIKDAVPKVEPKSRIGNPKSYKVFNKRYHVLAHSKGFKQTGLASWYGRKFHGFKTASGEVYDMYAMTAAHKTLPLPTYVRVTNLANRRSVIVKVTDRGPYHGNRIIDLSYAAAVKLGMESHGVGKVRVEAIDPKTYRKARKRRKTRQTPNPTLAQDQYLQVGAFSSRVNAKKLAQSLRQTVDYPVQIISEQKAKQTLYRVKVGPIKAPKAIPKLQQQLAANQYTDTWLVTKLN